MIPYFLVHLPGHTAFLNIFRYITFRVGGAIMTALLIAFLAFAARDARAFTADVRRATWSVVAILAVVCLFNATLFDALIGDYFCLLLGLLLALIAIYLLSM